MELKTGPKIYYSILVDGRPSKYVGPVTAADSIASSLAKGCTVACSLEVDEGYALPSAERCDGIMQKLIDRVQGRLMAVNISSAVTAEVEGEWMKFRLQDRV